MMTTFYAVLAVILAIGVPRDAEATCAWMLWTAHYRDPLGGSRVERWEVYQAYSDESSCRTFQNLLSTSWNQAERSRRDRGETPQPMVHYRCLPDTIDPRGPKGGGR